MTYPNGGASEIWRDTEGGSAHNPSKAEIRDWGAFVEKGVSGAISVFAYGAVGDGVTDDTAAVQSALDSGAKTILLPAGKTYLVSALNVPPNTNIISTERSDQTVPILKGSNANSNILTFADGTGCGVHGIGFDHGTTAGTGKAIDMLNPVRARITNCSVFSCPEGFDFRGTLVTSPGNNIYRDNYFANVGGTAIRLYRTHNDMVSGNRTDACAKGLHMEHSCFDNIVTGNEFSHCSTYGIETDGNSTGHIISDNVFSLNAVDMYLSGRSFKVVGNACKQSTANSLYLNIFRDSVITGNSFRQPATTADGTNRYSAIWGQNAVENVTISDNVFGCEIAATARYAVALRYSKDCHISGNQMARGYVTAPVLDEFPSGRNIYFDTVTETTPVLYDSATVDACEPWQAAVAGTLTMNNPPPPNRIMSISIRNNTAGVLSGNEIKVKNFAGSAEITISAADLLNMAAGEVRTFRCGAGSTNNAQMATTMAVAQPAGIELAYGVYDAYQVRGAVGSADDIVLATADGTALTVSNFSAANGDFDVSPSPAVGELVQITYKKLKNTT